MVRTKAQFELVLMAVAEEVHAILKALPQWDVTSREHFSHARSHT
jgi:hypothetical protein